MTANRNGLGHAWQSAFTCRRYLTAGIRGGVLLLTLCFAPGVFALSPAERAVIWTRIWTAVDERFVGFERIPYINWRQQFEAGLTAGQTAADDVEFWRDLRKRIALLENGATFLRFPSTLPRTFDTVPVRLTLAANRIMIRQLSSAPDLKAAGLRVGDELLSIDGVPALVYVRAVCTEPTSASNYESRLAVGVHKIFSGPAGTRAECVWRRPDGTEYRAKLLRDSGANAEWYAEFEQGATDDFRKFDGGIVYLNLRGSITRSAQESLLEFVRDRGTRGIIVDLRDTQAGIDASEFLRSVVKFPVWAWTSQYVRRTPRESEHHLGVLEFDRAWTPRDGELLVPTDPPFDGVIICLVGRETLGAAERFLQPLVETRRAVLIGDTTAGAGYEQMVIPLGDGAALTLAVTQPTWADGRGNGSGFPPDIWVQQSAAALGAGKDAVLDRALDYIRRGR